MPSRSSRHGSERHTRRESGRNGERNRRRGRRGPYSVYIYRVLKEMYPDAWISSKAMSIMNSFVNDIVERLAVESARLVRYNNRTTITPRDINSAARLTLPGEVATQAVTHSRVAVAKHTALKHSK
ncbi:hypothetical protein V3C99_005384 [Haemonchus contortus]|uniref:Histone domain-containing protein n=1 Tax=Haemonchus contortus TaxID=6289 RepID=A0A7I5E5G0_HAECO